EYVSPGYLRAIGVPLLAGQWPDDMDLGAVVINQSLARQLTRTLGPVGKEIHAAFLGGRIAGIVPDFKTSQLDAEANPAIYAPSQSAPRIAWIEAIVRVAANAAPLAPAIRERAAGIDASVPVYRVATLESELANSVAPRRFNLILLGSFAAVAVLLAFIGIYG